MWKRGREKEEKKSGQEKRWVEGMLERGKAREDRV